MKMNGNDDVVDVSPPVETRQLVPAPENEAAPRSPAGPAAAEPAPLLLSGCRPAFILD